MKWPWVSRATYDLHTQVLIDAQASIITQNEWLRDCYEALLEKYQDLVQPTNAVPVILPESAAPREVSLITQVIRDQSRGDQRLAGYLRAYASKLKAQGLSNEDIAANLTHWYSTEEAIS